MREKFAVLLALELWIYNQNCEAQIIAGLIVDLRITKSKKGGNNAFVTLDDRSARIEVTVFPDSYEEFRHVIVKDQVVVVEGEISVDEFRGGAKSDCS